MSLTLSILFLVGGIFLLYFGAAFLVKGSANIARILGVKPLIVGLTIVAFGTSMPEFTVSIFGVLQGASDISVGNIIGSNVANIGLILGTAGLIAPIALRYHHIRQQLLILYSAPFSSVLWPTTVFHNGKAGCSLRSLLPMLST